LGNFYELEIRRFIDKAALSAAFRSALDDFMFLGRLLSCRRREAHFASRISQDRHKRGLTTKARLLMLGGNAQPISWEQIGSALLTSSIEMPKVVFY
jgi:hypothetical protein